MAAPAGDDARAVAAWRTPAEGGDADAQLGLARAYRLGRGVPLDLAAALSWYRRAAAQGSIPAEDELGPLLFRMGDRRNAMPWIEKAAARGEVRALYVLGTAHFNGDLAPRDWPRSYALMRRAADKGLSQAKVSLAQMERFLSPSEKARGLELAGASAPPQAAATAPKPAGLPAKPVAPSTQVAAQPGKPSAAPPVAVADGPWRVQLGAYNSRKAAEAAWRPLLRTAPALRPYRRLVVEAGPVARLQAAGIAGRAEANRLCRTLAAVKLPCFPVAP